MSRSRRHFPYCAPDSAKSFKQVTQRKLRRKTRQALSSSCATGDTPKLPVLRQMANDQDHFRMNGKESASSLFGETGDDLAKLMRK
jgi:hypothetical protein